MDLKSDLSFMRNRIFSFRIKKRFSACMLRWVNLWCGITWLVASIYFLHARTWSLLMRRPAAVRYAWSLVRAGTSLARRTPRVSPLALAVGCICCTECTQVHFSLVLYIYGNYFLLLGSSYFHVYISRFKTYMARRSICRWSISSY